MWIDLLYRRYVVLDFVHRRYNSQRSSTGVNSTMNNFVTSHGRRVLAGIIMAGILAWSALIYRVVSDPCFMAVATDKVDQGDKFCSNAK